MNEVCLAVKVHFQVIVHLEKNLPERASVGMTIAMPFLSLQSCTCVPNPWQGPNAIPLKESMCRARHQAPSQVTSLKACSRIECRKDFSQQYRRNKISHLRICACRLRIVHRSYHDSIPNGTHHSLPYHIPSHHEKASLLLHEECLARCLDNLNLKLDQPTSGRGLTMASLKLVISGV